MSNADNLANLPPDEQAELTVLHQLSDDALWKVAAEQMPSASQERLSALLALNKQRVLSAAENAELDSLLGAGDSLILRKAEAAAILTKRGHTVTSKDMRSKPE